MLLCMHSRDPGILTRAVRLLLDQCKINTASGNTSICLKCSVVCLHNDLIVDLLGYASIATPHLIAVLLKVEERIFRVNYQCAK